MQIKLTKEQIDILEAVSNTHVDTMFINAFAGSGKTFILKEIATRNYNKNILYLVFNKKNRLHAQNTFPTNTEVHTSHSFSYQKIFSNKRHGSLSDITINSVRKIFGDMTVSEYVRIREQFVCEISSQNIQSDTSKKILSAMRNSVIPYSYEAMLYDAILMQKNGIHHDKVYDIILIDESQDINPLFLSLINSLHGQKIFVGDIYQSIYGFLGNINVLPSDSEHSFSLSRSFRFGEEYASIVGEICSILYQNNHFHIAGNPNRYTAFVSTLPENEPFVYIARTNAHILEEAYRLITTQNKKISIPLNYEEMKLLVQDVYFVSTMPDHYIPTSKKLFGIKNRDDLDRLGKIDSDVALAVRLVDKFGIRLMDMLETIRNNMVNHKYADVIFVTAHKSKGLEFDNVMLGRDFNIDKIISSQDEKNLLYVALTRAKGRMQADHILRDIANIK